MASNELNTNLKELKMTTEQEDEWVESMTAKQQTGWLLAEVIGDLSGLHVLLGKVGLDWNTPERKAMDKLLDMLNKRHNTMMAAGEIEPLPVPAPLKGLMDRIEVKRTGTNNTNLKERT